IVEHLSRNGHDLEIAKIDRLIRAALPGDVGWRSRGLRPSGWRHFADLVSSRSKIGETVVAVGVGRGARLVIVQLAVAVVVEVNGPALEACLTGIERAVRIGVEEH